LTLAKFNVVIAGFYTTKKFPITGIKNTGRTTMRRIRFALLATAAAFAGSATMAQAETKTARIAFSNNYAGNSWRQAMLKSYDLVAKKAVADKIIAAADVFTTSDKEVTTQAARSRT
jgi:ABC-type sugar transport system substrate-binding protein